MKVTGQKLPDGGRVNGRGRLIDLVVDKMQNSYGIGIRENSGELDGIKRSIWAIYHRMIREESKSPEEQHKKCPKETDSWCKFR